MRLSALLLATLWSCTIFAFDYHCSKRAALQLLKWPAYKFSVKLLQRITDDTDAHFVHSPLASWLQLMALSEGATGRTFQEVWEVTRHHRNSCFKRKLGQIVQNLLAELRPECNRDSVIAADALMGVKKRFQAAVRRLYGTKVMLLNFDDKVNAAVVVNKEIAQSTKDAVDTIVYYDDFNSTLSLLLSEGNYFKGEWASPFDSALTKPQNFYYLSKGVRNKIGEVNMMNQVGYFNVTYYPKINARVLEMPFSNTRLSMLVFLNMREAWVGETFYQLKKTRLTSIFNYFKTQKPRLVSVSLPRFKITSEIDNLAELIDDMGIKRIFNPDTAEFKGISDYKLYVSLVTQISDIEVTEKGVVAHTSVENLIDSKNSSAFIADRPFGYMIVDRNTEFILYAGIYSKPSVF